MAHMEAFLVNTSIPSLITLGLSIELALYCCIRSD